MLFIYSIIANIQKIKIFLHHYVSVGGRGWKYTVQMQNSHQWCTSLLSVTQLCACSPYFYSQLCRKPSEPTQKQLHRNSLCGDHSIRTESGAWHCSEDYRWLVSSCLGTVTEHITTYPNIKTLQKGPLKSFTKKASLHKTHKHTATCGPMIYRGVPLPNPCLH